MSEQLAIDGGQPTRTEPFPSWPVFDDREEKALLEVLHSARWGIGGSKGEAFARKFAEFQGARFGIPVPNGTSALELSLRALGVRSGDEVITSPYTFVATASPILWLGAKPVFVDIEWDSFNIDPAKIEAAITPRTKAIIPVHLGGRPADMDGVVAVAKKHNLPVLEDACQAWGSSWRGQGVGGIGSMGAFSFQSSKNINAGEGGMVLTNDSDLYELAWSLHNVGRSRTGDPHHQDILGGNMRMTEWAAAVLLVQLERLPEHTEIRQNNARYLGEALSEIEGLSPLAQDDRITSNGYHLFRIRYDATAFGGHTKDEFVTTMRAEGITPCGPGYVVSLAESPAIRQAMAERFGADSAPDIANYPVTKRASTEGMWLSQTALLGSRQDMDSIVAAIQKIQRAWG